MISQTECLWRGEQRKQKTRARRQGEVKSMTLRYLIATILFGFASCTAGHAQVTVDVSKITCDQLTLYKITDPQNIAIWLSGYYHGKRDNTFVDTQQLAANTEKIKTYCRLKPDVTVMQAVETVFGPQK
jgi:acid stress chaperone HdeB